MADGVKTGGRPPKKTLLELLDDARVQSDIAALHDDTTLPEALAAAYVGLSPAKMADLRTTGDGPEFIKHIEKAAVGQNQPVFYKLGALREWQKKNTVKTTWAAVLNSGMLGFVTLVAPFFAVEDVSPRGRRTAYLAAPAWDEANPDRETLFKLAADGSLALEWMSPSQAAASPWVDAESQKPLADAWRAVLSDEGQALDAAIERTEIAAIAFESGPQNGVVLRD